MDVSAENLQTIVLQQVSKYDIIDSAVLANALEIDHQLVVGAVKSIQCFEDVIQVEQKTTKKWDLTAEGVKV